MFCMADMDGCYAHLHMVQLPHQSQNLSNVRSRSSPASTRNPQQKSQLRFKNNGTLSYTSQKKAHWNV